MKHLNKRLCRHCLNELLGTKLKTGDCLHELSRCSCCEGEYSHYTVANVTLIGRLKLIRKTA